MCELLSCVQLLGPQGLYPARLLCPWDSPVQNTGAGSHALLQGIFSTQGLNPDVLHCRQILYKLSHKGSQVAHIPAAAAAKSLQSCATLCDPIDGSPPGSPIPGILQARVLEWVAIAFSDALILYAEYIIRNAGLEEA